MRIKVFLLSLSLFQQLLLIVTSHFIYFYGCMDWQLIERGVEREREKGEKP